MLDLYKDKQPLFYNEVMNCLNNNKISHAYLIETNDWNEADGLILAFVKQLFRKYISDDDLYNNIETLIMNNCYSDFIVIESDGMWIKKEQILDAKEKFKMTSFQNSPRIYLIKNADLLNKYAANSLLKFLEEPEGNIIAILTTNNRYKVIETIRSRCQIYSLLNDKKVKDLFNLELTEKIIETLEKKKKNSIAYLPILLENDLKNKDFWKSIFNDMIEVYYNSLRKYENIDYIDYGSIISLITSLNSIQSIINKISILFATINDLDYNLNINMLLDKFIIEFSGGDLDEKNC